MTRVAIVAAAAVSAFGLTWRGLGEAVATRALAPRTAFEVPPISPADDAGDARARKAMSRPARLAAIALRHALAEAAWSAEEREGAGLFLGVGASGGPIGEMVAMLRASLDEHGRVSAARLGAEGLLASNPLFTFHVLNNFTLCHGAILEGVQGPNAALFSRGGGTVEALREAVAALAGGDCERAIAGGADTALHPATWSELVRDGHAGDGLVPGEGAGLLALARAELCAQPLGFVESVVRVPRRRELSITAMPRPVDRVLIAPAHDRARAILSRIAATSFPGTPIDDVTAALGEALAATPALGWVAAVDRLAAGDHRVVVLSAGIDGDLGVVTLAREAAA